MGGFRLRCSEEDKETFKDKLLFHYDLGDGTWEGVLTYNTLMFFVVEQPGRLELPSMSEEEIKDRSKGDELFKTLAVLQLLWFAVQIIVRASMHLNITNIELTTSALVVSTISMYWCWWDKPLDVQCPVVLHLSSPTNEPAAEEGSTPSEDSEHAEDVSTEAFFGDPHLSMTEGRQHIANRDHRGIQTRLVRQLIIMDRALATMTPAPIRKTLRFLFLFPAHVVNHVGIWPLAALWCSIERGTYKPFPRNRAIAVPLIVRSNKETVLSILYIAHTGTLSASLNLQILIIFGALFGGIHCAAWRYPFSTPVEQSLWRIAACIITAPLGIGLSFALYRFTISTVFRILWRKKEHSGQGPVDQNWMLKVSSVPHIMNVIGILSYCTARVVILLLSITSLRKLPPTALQTVDWLNLIPHM